MKKSVLASLSLVLLLATAAVAQTEGDQQAMMDMWLKMSTPGAPHEGLAKSVGTWDAKVKMWMDPAAPPEESTGTSVNTMILGGRWLEQRYTGSMMGQPFEGVGYTGYDNYKKEYVGTWMDTSSTAPMMTTGQMAADGKSATFTGTMDDFMTGKACQMKEVLTFTDADHQTFEMWASGPDGQMYKNMEINYTRRK